MHAYTSKQTCWACFSNGLYSQLCKCVAIQGGLTAGKIVKINFSVFPSPRYPSIGECVKQVREKVEIPCTWFTQLL